MNKKRCLYLIIIVIIVIIVFLSIFYFRLKNKIEKQNSNIINDTTLKLNATVIAINDNKITVQDSTNIIYTFNLKKDNIKLGDNIVFEYEGKLNKNTEYQTIDIINWKPASNRTYDNGIFSNYYKLANKKLEMMTLDEKISQLLLVRYPNINAKGILDKYQFGGYIFFAKDFQNKTETEVKNMIRELQAVSNIPILTAVDEEGGKVVRISSNPNLVSKPFKTSQELYNLGGFTRIRDDTINKSKILSNLGINLNLAPVVDV